MNKWRIPSVWEIAMILIRLALLLLLKMTPDKQGNAYQFVHDQEPSWSVIEAVAWIKGVETDALAPLNDAIDADALDALFQPGKTGEPTVTFAYAGCDVHVDSDHAIVRRESSDSLHDEFDGAANVLVLETSADRHNHELCSDLLRVEPDDNEDVLSVTFPSRAGDHRAVWSGQVSNHPTNVGLITVGDFNRSASTQSTNDESAPGQIQTDTVPDPSNLSELGVRINERLSAWEDNENQTVMCFRSLTSLLDHVDLQAVFRFLHILTRRITSSGAVAHYHLDVNAHDEETLATLKPLFDTVIEVDQTGDWEVSS